MQGKFKLSYLPKYSSRILTLQIVVWRASHRWFSVKAIGGSLSEMAHAASAASLYFCCSSLSSTTQLVHGFNWLLHFFPSWHCGNNQGIYNEHNAEFK
jgi:hypothetical protein